MDIKLPEKGTIEGKKFYKGDEIYSSYKDGIGGVIITPKAEVERRKKYEKFWHFFRIDSHFPYKRSE